MGYSKVFLVVIKKKEFGIETRDGQRGSTQALERENWVQSDH
jgi:hypothetical protein